MVDSSRSNPHESKVRFANHQFLYLPGVIDKGVFMELCEGCLDCARACPHDCITYIETEPDVRYPFINPNEAPCYLCADMPCSAACPSGAVTSLPLRKVKMGAAMLDPMRCLCITGEDCRICVDVCPLSGDAITWDSEIHAPLINISECAGCGVCLHECPAPKRPIIIVPY